MLRVYRNKTIYNIDINFKLFTILTLILKKG